MAEKDTKRARPTPARPTTASGSALAPAEARRPQQERGQRRVEAILDATAAIVAEDGAPAVTMHAIARRSGTTIGSLYHFFPDRDAVFSALLERHAARIGERFAPLESVDWTRLSVEQSVERFLEAGLGYIDRNPDLLPVAHVLHAEHPKRPRNEGPEQLFQRITEAMIAAHAPGASRTARVAQASMVIAAVEGAVERSHRAPTPAPAAMRRELARMLCTYIESLR